MKRTAQAEWNGGLKDGKGTLTTASGILSATPYSFATRFEDGGGTNPEELIAAAHAGCFTMALSSELGRAGIIPEKITTQAILNMEKDGSGWTIVSIHLQVKAKVAGTDRETFLAAAGKVEKSCPVSRALNVKISMAAELE